MQVTLSGQQLNPTIYIFGLFADYSDGDLSWYQSRVEKIRLL